jgi:hypothetical protein
MSIGIKKGDTVTVMFAGENRILTQAEVIGYDKETQQWVFEAPIQTEEGEPKKTTVYVKEYEAIMVSKRATDQ